MEVCLSLPPPPAYGLKREHKCLSHLLDHLWMVAEELKWVLDTVGHTLAWTTHLSPCHVQERKISFTGEKYAFLMFKPL